MEHDFSAYTVESLEIVEHEIYRVKQIGNAHYNTCLHEGKKQEALEYADTVALCADLISMLSEAKTKSLAFRKGMEHKIDTLKIKANYK